MNEVILETMKDNDDKFWHLQKQVDDLSWMVFQLEERIDAALVLLGERIQKIEGPPIPKPNPKSNESNTETPTEFISHQIWIDTPGRVELREMLISICKEVYKYWPRNQDEIDRYDVFVTYMQAKGWDYKKDIRPELWAQEHKFKNHEMEEALRILGVME